MNRPFEVNREFLLAKCNYFADVHLWPIRARLDPSNWLSNFTDKEMDHAIHLLNAFVYITNDLVDQLFLSAFQAISRRYQEPSGLLTKTAWQQFCDRALITYVTGEQPSPADSGFLFARRARQVLGLSESQILSPQDCLECLIKNGPNPVVFVDDFVGTGSQFLRTWNRAYHVAALTTSFNQYARLASEPLIYCPLLCTSVGLARLTSACNGATIAPAHVLTSRYNALSADSFVWPARLAPTAEQFIREASRRAGIDDDFGIGELGLTLAFEHCVPDATLPMIYWEQNGWHPLIRRV